METKVILVSCPSTAKAEAIAQTLVEAGLAACINIVPSIISVYKWKDKIEKENEALLIIKSSDSQIAALEQKVIEIHPYSTPEFVVLDSSFVTEKYQQWMGSVLE